MIQTVGVRQVVVMLVAMGLTSLGMMTAPELVAVIRQKFGL